MVVYKQMDLHGRVDKLPVVLQSVRLERNVSPFCIYARTTYTETIIDAWWSQGMTIKECIYHSREYHAPCCTGTCSLKLGGWLQ